MLHAGLYAVKQICMHACHSRGAGLDHQCARCRAADFTAGMLHCTTYCQSAPLTLQRPLPVRVARPQEYKCLCVCTDTEFRPLT